MTTQTGSYSKDVSQDNRKPAQAAKTATSSERSKKSKGAFRTISEVADELDVQQHVLRFWETKFSQVRPLKRGGGRRYYRPEDVELLKRIHQLLYTEGYTIKGVQKLFRQNGKSSVLEGEVSGPAIMAGTTNTAGADLRSGDEAAMEAAQPQQIEVEGQAAPTPEPVVITGKLSMDQRTTLQSMLAELKDLRAAVAATA